MGFWNLLGLHPQERGYDERTPARKRDGEAARGGQRPRWLASSGTSHSYELKPSDAAIIYKSEFDVISRFILDRPNIETGGNLFGFWTSTGTPVIAYATGPGHNARHEDTMFVQDWDYVKRVGTELYHCFRLQHIGEWHSHHQLGLAHPSGGDVQTMSYGVGKPGFPRMLLCIGNCNGRQSTLNAFNFHESNPATYVHAAWDIIDEESPYRPLIDSRLRNVIVQPRTRRASHAHIHSVAVVTNTDTQERTHWLTESTDNVETMKKFVAIVQLYYPEHSVKAEMLDSGEPQIVIPDADLCIRLPHGFPAQAPVLQNSEGEPYGEPASGAWEIGEEPLTSAFKRWLTITSPALTANNDGTTALRAEEKDTPLPTPGYDEEKRDLLLY